MSLNGQEKKLSSFFVSIVQGLCSNSDNSSLPGVVATKYPPRGLHEGQDVLCHEPAATNNFTYKRARPAALFVADCHDKWRQLQSSVASVQLISHSDVSHGAIDSFGKLPWQRSTRARGRLFGASGYFAVETSLTSSSLDNVRLSLQSFHCWNNPSPKSLVTKKLQDGNNTLLATNECVRFCETQT